MATQPVHARVLDRLGAEIVAGALPPGSSLTLDDVRTRFAVSRTAAREAMRVLEHLMLVEPRRRVGLVVRPRADWAALDPRVLAWRRAGPGAAAQRRASAELRAAVLPAAAAASARHADGTEVDRLVALTADLRLGPPTRLLTTHGAVLRLVLVTSRNDLIAATAAAVLPGPADPDRVAALGRTGVLDRHDALAAAVAARDPEAARRAMTALVAATDGLA